MTLLNEAQITEHLAALPAWHRVGEEIRAEFRGEDFLAAMALVDAVATRAEAAGHHPDIDIRYDTVRFALSSHSDGGLTDKDFALAARIDGAAAATAMAPAPTD